ncbi:MAG: hypothetical protein AAF916_06390 [Planctomycetota bacterium]
MFKLMAPQESIAVRETLVVGWSGHRNIDAAVVTPAIESVVAELVGSGRRIAGLGSVAIGCDLLVAGQLDDAGVPLLLLLPYDREAFETEAAAEEVAEIDRLLGVARDVTVTGHVRDEDRYLELGAQTVEGCGVLIAVWDGEAARGAGGTGDVIELANAQGTPVIRIDSRTGETTWPDGLDLSDDPAALEVPRTKAGIDELHDRFSQEADKHAWPSRLLLFRIILLHLIAAGIAVSALVFDKYIPTDFDSIAAGVFKVAALVWALVLAAKHRKHHRSWLSQRTAAEWLRAFSAIWPLRRDVVHVPTAVHSATRDLRRELELAWHLAEDGRADDPVSAAQGYATDRIDDQIAYFRKRAAMAHRWHHVLHKAAGAVTGAAIACGSVAVVLALQHIHGPFFSAIKFLSIVLPLTTAAILSAGISSDTSRRAGRYEEIAAELEQLEQQLEHARSWGGVGKVASRTEAVLLDELGEWHAFTRFAGESH